VFFGQDHVGFDIVNEVIFFERSHENLEFYEKINLFFDTLPFWLFGNFRLFEKYKEIEVQTNFKNYLFQTHLESKSDVPNVAKKLVEKCSSPM
jgi:hypothetical protein